MRALKATGRAARGPHPESFTRSGVTVPWVPRPERACRARGLGEARSESVRRRPGNLLGGMPCLLSRSPRTAIAPDPRVEC